LLTAALFKLVLTQASPGRSLQGAPGGGGGFVPIGGGGGSIDPEALPWVIGGCAVVIVLILFIKLAESHRNRPPDAREFVRQTEPRSSTSVHTSFPSGVWRGYYHQFRSRHNLCDFTFAFLLQGQRVTGSGVDDVGCYNIEGIYGTDQVAFRKQYILNSQAVDGRVNRAMNKGHAVEYRGKKVGESLGQGIKGEWYIQQASSGYSGKGHFHLWPAMPDWHQFNPSAPPDDEAVAIAVPVAPVVAAPVRFNITTDNICVVCFDQPIDVCLLPCGHVAICGVCSKRLQDCPICRQTIAGRCSSDGNPFASASAPPFQPLLATMA